MAAFVRAARGGGAAAAVGDGRSRTLPPGCQARSCVTGEAAGRAATSAFVVPARGGGPAGAAWGGAGGNSTAGMPGVVVRAIAAVLKHCAPCNLMVFGLGGEMPFWRELNHGRLQCLPEDWMHDEMPRLAMRLPLPPGDDAALAREAHEVAAAEAQAEEDARRDAELAARRTPKRDHARHPVSTWRRQLWMVILADLVLLAILFVAWLAVCRGFSCIGR